MSAVLSIRIPRELKRKLEELSSMVDWRREIIEFLSERVKYYRRLRALQHVEQILQKHPELPRGTAARLVREDRDSG